jgi:hypothetical protein
MATSYLQDTEVQGAQGGIQLDEKLQLAEDFPSPATDNDHRQDHPHWNPQAVDLMTEFLEIQGLLFLLTDATVRKDFLNNDVIVLDDPELILFTLDLMRPLLVPVWSSSIKVRKVAALQAAEHVRALMREEQQIFVIPAEGFFVEHHSYKYWKRFFGKLLVSQYWKSYQVDTNKEVRLTDRLIKLKQTSREESKSPTHHQRKQTNRKLSPVCNVKDEVMDVAPRSLRRVIPPTVAEEIDLCDSDESTSDSDTGDCSSSWEDARCSVRRKRVVTPLSFNAEGSQSLKKFFVIYETYFKSKFRGGELECSIELARFLTGEALDAYNSFGGAEKNILY